MHLLTMHIPLCLGWDVMVIFVFPHQNYTPPKICQPPPFDNECHVSTLPRNVKHAQITLYFPVLQKPVLRS